MRSSIEARFDEAQKATLRKKVLDFGILHILNDITKSLQCVTPENQIDAANQINIPHGLFGLSLKMFYVRREVEDQSYLEALRIIFPKLVQDAKNCIVLDDIQDLISKLGQGLVSGNVHPVLNEIDEAVQLLGIQDVIYGNLIESTKASRRLSEKLKNFTDGTVRSMQAIDLKMNRAMMQVFEESRVLHPIEFRYTKSFSCNTEGCEHFCSKKEQDIRSELNTVKTKHNREVYCTTSVCTAMIRQIFDLKERLNAMEDKFHEDYEKINGMVGYISNYIESLQHRRKECEAKLIKFAQEMPGLVAWYTELQEQEAERRRQELLALLKPKKKKRGKKKKEEEGAKTERK